MNSDNPLPRRKPDGGLGLLLLDKKIIRNLATIAATVSLRPEQALEEALLEWCSKKGYNLITGERTP